MRPGAPQRGGRSLGLSIPNPLAWINQKLIEWMGVPKRLGDSLNVVIPIYSQARDPAIKSAAKSALDQLGGLVGEYDAVSKKLVFKSNSLSAVGLIVIAVAASVSIVAVSIAMYSILRRTTAAENAARSAADLAAACAAGRISCEQVLPAIDGLNEAMKVAPDEKGPIAEAASALSGGVQLIVTASLAVAAYQLLGPELRKLAR